MFTKKAVVFFKGKKQEVQVPCSPDTPYEKVMQLAIKMLEQKEKERIKKEYEEIDAQLEAFFQAFQASYKPNPTF